MTQDQFHRAVKNKKFVSTTEYDKVAGQNTKKHVPSVTACFCLEENVLRNIFWKGCSIYNWVREVYDIHRSPGETLDQKEWI